MHGFVIAGTHSGCGKTTVTIGLLAALRKKGLTVQSFKAGPDFIDSGLHRLITGRPSRNLDIWMCGKEGVAECFLKHSAEADIAIVEGVMGMHDGAFSTAHLARHLGLPVILVVDAYGMAESAGAVVKGFAEFENVKDPDTLALCRSDSRIAGVIFNRVASGSHYMRLKDSVRDIPVLGYLPRDLDFEIPHRHLGLVVAEEGPLAGGNIEKLADTVLKHIDVDTITRHTAQGMRQEEEGIKQPMISCSSPIARIAVAYDKAFCFYYEDNLDMLRDAGAEVVRFSPISDTCIPAGVDAVYLGGGYPELYAGELSRNASMLGAVREWSLSGRPLYAECGGLMYLSRGIHGFEGDFYGMAGIFDFETRMKKGRSRLGYREVLIKEKCIMGVRGEICRGHEFHYSEIINDRDASGVECHASKDKDNNSSDARRSTLDARLSLCYSLQDGSGGFIQDEGYSVGKTLASYVHVHFGSNSRIADNFLNFIREK